MIIHKPHLLPKQSTLNESTRDIRPTLSQSEIPAESSASSDIRLSVKKLTPSTNPAVFVDGIDFFRLLSTKRGLFVDVRTDHVHELLAFLYKPASSKSRMFAVPIHILLPQGRCARRECLPERVTWFACALVKEKVEMCADEMPPKAQNKGCIRTCRETMSS